MQSRRWCTHRCRYRRWYGCRRRRQLCREDNALTCSAFIRKARCCGSHLWSRGHKSVLPLLLCPKFPSIFLHLLAVRQQCGFATKQLCDHLPKGLLQLVFAMKQSARIRLFWPRSKVQRLYPVQCRHGDIVAESPHHSVFEVAWMCLGEFWMHHAMGVYRVPK